MRGLQADIKEIILQQWGEEPENIDLRCSEVFDENDLAEEEQEQVPPVPTPSDSDSDADLFSVETACAFCSQVVTFVCKARDPGIRNLQSVLVTQDLEFTCWDCVREYGIEGLRQQ
uniref:Protein E7 n=1 Tax=Tadarida brasiliensis papillomavirus TaxID=2507922 RepID=A0A411F029_9PAPI|nr:putative early protein E7 [Tadarida brasiliensis papillomavirus]